MQENVRAFRRKIGLLILIAIAPIISGCVESHTPILTKAEPLFGPQFQVHLYDTFIAGQARGVQVLRYRWNDHGYERIGQQSGDDSEFAVQSLDDKNFIVQTHNMENALFHYSIARKIFDGVVLVFPIEESDADATTLVEICGNEAPTIICMIQTYDQLVTLARATAAKPPHNPLVGVIVRDGG